MGARTVGRGFHAYFSGFGFLEAFRNPGEDAPAPLMMPDENAVHERMVEHDFSLCGTPDDIKRQMEKISTIYGEGQAEWFGWAFQQGLMTWDEAQWQLETFANEILPEFKD